MLFRSALVLFGLAVFAPSLSAQDAGWGTPQLRSVSDYARDLGPETPPAGPAAIRAYVDIVQDHWGANEASAQEGASQLAPYAAYLSVYGIYKIRDVEMEPSVQCDVYAEAIAPSFVDMVDRAERNAGVLRELFRPYNVRVVTDYYPLSCDLSPERWDRLYRAVGRLPDLSVRAAAALPDSAESAQLDRALRFASDVMPLLGVRNAIRHDSLDAADAGLSAAIERGDEPYSVRETGDRLWRAFAAKGQTDRAFETLDLLGARLARAVLSADTLGAWYQTVDAVDGPVRFVASKVSDQPIYIASDLRPDLSGRYTDLLTGDTVSFDDGSLADGSDALTLIDLWATWCSNCIPEIPILKDLAERHAGRLRLVSVSVDAIQGDATTDDVRAFMERYGIDYPVLLDDPDNSLAARLNVRGYPAKFLLAADGTLLVAPNAQHPQVSLDDVDAYLSSLD